MKQSGIIPIDRSKGKKVMPQLIEGGKAFLKAGRSVFMFPEGNRKPVEAPTKLRPGIGALYEEAQVPVYPVALNTGMVWGRRSFLKKPGKVIYRILPPLQPGLKKEALLSQLEEILEKETRQLCQ